MKVIDEENRCLIDILEVLKLCHPVGSYYWSVDSTNPSQLFGGIWERVTDRFVYALGDEGQAGDTGGSETHKHTQAGTTGSTTLTASQSGVPAHNHTTVLTKTAPEYKGLPGNGPAYAEGGFLISGGPIQQNCVSNNNTAKNATQGHTHTLGSTNEASSLPPYEKAYCWKRIS